MEIMKSAAIWRNGPQVDFPDSLGKTALHLAIGYGHIPVVEMLLNLDVPANTSIKDKAGKIPSAYALEEDMRNVLRHNAGSL